VHPALGDGHAQLQVHPHGLAFDPLTRLGKRGLIAQRFIRGCQYPVSIDQVR
jgi:hypothetical protein